MPTRKNTKRSDWLWVQLKQAERANQGKKTEFRFDGQIFGDKRIEKGIRTHVGLTEGRIAKEKNEMPETPKGWMATTPPATTEPTFEPPSHHTPNNEQKTRYRSSLQSFIDKISESVTESDWEEFVSTMFKELDFSDVADETDESDQTAATLLPSEASPDLEDNNGNPSLPYNSWYNFHRPNELRDDDLLASLSDWPSKDEAYGLNKHDSVLPIQTPVDRWSRSWRKSHKILKAADTGDSESFVHHLIEADADDGPTDLLESTLLDHMEDSSKHKSIPPMVKPKFPRYYSNGILAAAAAAGNADEVRLAIERGADPSCTIQTMMRYLDSPNLGWTPLHFAAHYGRFEAAQLLIEAGARINQRCRLGRTPLDMTYDFRWYRSDIVKLLIENGAKRTLINSTGERVLEEQENREGKTQVVKHELNEEINSDAEEISPSPMSWQYTALGAPEVLKDSPYKLSRFLGCSTRSAAISIDGSSYRPSTPGKASLSLREILARNKHEPHKSWSTPPMHTPPL